MRKSIFIAVFSFFVSQGLFAQQFPPSQYFSTPLAVNPAMTGLIASDMRLAVNYDHLLVPYPYSPYHYSNISYDMPVLKGVLPKGDALGVGLLHQNRIWDNSYYLYKYRNATTALSLAYHKSIGKKHLHHISLGTQAAYTNNFVSFIDTTIKHASKYSYTFNVGLMYSGTLSEKVAVYGGGAVYGLHNGLIKNPYVSWPVYEEYYSLMAGSTITVRKNTQLYINLTRHTDNDWHLWQVSSYARFLLNPKNSKKPLHMYAGALYRVEADVSPYIGFEMANVRLGISSDLDVPAHPGGRRINGFELSLIYKGRLGVKKNPNWHCPTMY